MSLVNWSQNYITWKTSVKEHVLLHFVLATAREQMNLCFVSSSGGWVSSAEHWMSRGRGAQCVKASLVVFSWNFENLAENEKKIIARIKERKQAITCKKNATQFDKKIGQRMLLGNRKMQKHHYLGNFVAMIGKKESICTTCLCFCLWIYTLLIINKL